MFTKNIFIFLFQEYDTDREYVGVTTLNDYTGIQLKAESADYDEKLFLKTAKLCSAVQCGHEDNPKSKNIFSCLQFRPNNSKMYQYFSIYFQL